MLTRKIGLWITLAIWISACALQPSPADPKALQTAQAQIATLQVQVTSAQLRQKQPLATPSELPQAFTPTTSPMTTVILPPTLPPTQPARRTLEIWMRSDASLQEAFDHQWIPRFEQAYPGVTVQVTAIPAAVTEEYDARLLTAFNAGQGPDLWEMGDWDTQQFAASKFLAPMDPAVFGYGDPQEMVNAFAPSTMDAFIQPGTAISAPIVYSIPYQYNTLALYFNPDMFNARNIPLLPDDSPLTWDRILNIAARLHYKDPQTGSIQRVGYAFGFFTADRSPLRYALDYYQILRQYGQDDLFVDGKPVAVSDASIKAFDLIYRFTHEYNIYSPDLIKDPLTDLAQGRLGMVQDGPLFGKALDQQASDFTFGLAPVPVVDLYNQGTYRNVAWAWSWAVNNQKTGPRQELAMQFLAFMLGKKGETSQAAWWFDTLGYLQPRQAFLNSDVYLQAQAARPWLKQWTFALQHYQIGYVPHIYDPAGQALRRAIDRVVYDGKRGDETAALLQKDLQQINP